MDEDQYCYNKMCANWTSGCKANCLLVEEAGDPQRVFERCFCRCAYERLIDRYHSIGEFIQEYMKCRG